LVRQAGLLPNGNAGARGSDHRGKIIEVACDPRDAFEVTTTPLALPTSSVARV
jgi:hypothetical protein